MNVDTFDWAAALTTQGASFQADWSRFMFNIEAMVQLRSASKDKIMEVLQAGSAYLGGGWTTGKASKALYELSGVAIVRPQIEPYRDCWLYALALLFNVDLPTVDLQADCAEAAFALAHYLEHPEGETHQPEGPVEVDADSDSDTPQFSWDEPEQELPKELLELWHRAATGKQRIEMRKLLEQRPRLTGIPSRAPDNQLVPEFKKKADTFLKTVSQSVLNMLRLSSYRWITGPDPTLELQLFQLLAELHFKVSQERRELAVPGIKRREESTEGLFSEDDVRAQRAELNISRLSMQNHRVFHQRGGFSHKPSVANSFLLSAEHTGNYHKAPWRGKGAKGWKGGKGPRGQPYTPTWRGGQGGYGATWKGGRGPAKGVLLSGHEGSSKSNEGHGGTESGHGGSGMETVSRPVVRAQPLPATERVSPMVGSSCITFCDKPDQGRGRTPFPRQKLAVQGAAEVRARSFPGFGGHVRVRGSGSSQRAQSSGSCQHKVLGALVRHSEKRALRESKKPFNFGLSSPQSKFATPQVQARSLEGHFSPPGKRNVGDKSGSQKCVLSPGAEPATQTLGENATGGQNFSDGGSLLRTVNPTLSLDGGHVSVLEKMEKNGSPRVHLPGRHFASVQVKKFGSKSDQPDCTGFNRQWDGNQLQEKCSAASPAAGTPRFPPGLEAGSASSPHSENKSHSERIRKICGPKDDDLQKGGGHFGPAAIFSHSSPSTQSILRHVGPIHRQTQKSRVGFSLTNTRKRKAASSGNRSINANLAGKKFSGLDSRKKNLFRLQHPGVGGSGYYLGKKVARVLEIRKGPPHKHKGAKSVHCSSAIPGKAGGNSFSLSGQSGSLQLPQKRRRQVTCIQQFAQTLSHLVSHQKRATCAKLGKKRGNVGRQHLQVGTRQRRLHSQKINLSGSLWNICQKQFFSRNRLLCQPWKHPVGAIHQSLASQPGQCSKCPGVQPGQLENAVCQPPLESDSPMAGEASSESSSQMFNHSSLLGWNCLVAPVNSLARQKISSAENQPSLGDVLQLPGGGDAPTQVAPDLSGIIREGLQRKQVSPENIEHYLKNIKSFSTYNRAFQALWRFCVSRGGTPCACPQKKCLAGYYALLRFYHTQQEMLTVPCF